MNYSVFCCYRERISSLTKEEIKNPLSVLEAIYGRRDIKIFKEDLWEFFWAVYKDQLWRKNGAAHLHSTYKDLIRLLDALWLINIYYPELSTVSSSNHQPTSKQMSTFNLLFVERQRNYQKIENSQKNSLSEFYDSNAMAFTKIYIYNYLQIALNASYMGNDKYDYFAIREVEVVNDFLGFEALIEEGQNICNKSKTPVQNSTYKKYIKFASDVDQTTTISYNSLAAPTSYNSDLYEYYLRFEQMAESLRIWEKSFYEKNFWLNADGPGNMLYLSECLEKLIDCTWLLMQKDQLNINTPKRKLTNSKKKLYQTLNEQDFHQPFLVVKSFFEHKKMHEWKTQLNEWTRISLSYTETIKTENITKTSVDLQHLLKFIEATHLLIN